jgi:hypothetical protein
MKRRGNGYALVCIILTAVALFSGGGCKKKDKKPWYYYVPAPAITDINSATDPKSPTGVAIEINGAGFGAVPGQVRFQEGTNIEDVMPDASGWNDTSIIVVVPDSGSEGAFTVPGTVTVYVIAVGGVSNGIDLDLVDVPTFSPNNLVWGTSTVLPEARTGLRAATLKKDDSEAYMYVSGGQSSTGNTDELIFVSLYASATSFTVSNSWTIGSTMPETRAFHEMVSAEAPNSPVAANTGYLYLIGGQADAATPLEGTDTVWYALVDKSDGSVGSWVPTSLLPAPLLGHAAIVYRGYLYVIGGFDTSGDPVSTIYAAAIQTNGSLGSFTVATNPLPQALGLAGAFAFGGKLYVVGGETASTADPNDLSVGSASGEVYYAQLVGGDVGTFSTTAGMVKNVKKHLVFNAFGQVIRAEGIYNGWGSMELESSSVDTDGTLNSWGGLTGSEVPGADVFNCAGALSPVYQTGGGPRFFIIGGMDSSGVRQVSMYVNTAP